MVLNFKYTDLREKFKDIQKQCSPESRSTYIYPTTVTVCRSIPMEELLMTRNAKDTEATAVTLESGKAPNAGRNLSC